MGVRLVLGQLCASRSVRITVVIEGLHVPLRKMVPMKQICCSRSVKSMALRASVSRELARMMFALCDGVQGEAVVLLNGPECSCTKGALVDDEARVEGPRLVRGGQDLSLQMRITPGSRERDAVDGPRSPLRVYQPLQSLGVAREANRSS